MAFKELDDKLNELQSEVGKESASEHIGEARKLLNMQPMRGNTDKGVW